MTTAAPTSLTAEALAGWPAWSEARARLDALAALDLPADVRELERPEQTAARLLEHVITGDLTADDLTDAVATEQAHQSAAAAVAVAVTRARHEARTALAALEGSRPASRYILDHLDNQLRELLDRAAVVMGKLGSIAEVVAAAEAGKLDLWREAEQLAEQYRHIRAEQSTTWHRVDSLGRSLRELDVLGLPWLERPEAVDPELLARRARTPVRVPHAAGGGWNERAALPPPWPRLDGGHDPLTALRWLVEHPEAGPWVPNPDRFEAAAEALTERVRAFIEEQNGTPPRRPAAVRHRDRTGA